MRRLSDIDLRLLRIFATIVDCNGFRNAQIALNMAPSTLSAHLTTLEARLGSRLCERGRGGFRLTQAGEETYRSLQDLFRAIESFDSRMRRLSGGGQERLRLGVIDTVVSFRELALTRAVASFGTAHPQAFVDVEVLSPEHLQRALLEGRRDLVIGPGLQPGPSLVHRELAVEEHRLYCGRGHPWFTRADSDISLQDVRDARLSVRAYRYFDDTYKLGGARASASVTNMEAQLILILSAGFVGFLPDHCAEPHLAAGAVRAVKPREWILRSRFVLAYEPEGGPQALKRAFADRLAQALGPT